MISKLDVYKYANKKRSEITKIWEESDYLQIYIPYMYLCPQLSTLVNIAQYNDLDEATFNHFKAKIGNRIKEVQALSDKNDIRKHYIDDAEVYELHIQISFYAIFPSINKNNTIKEVLDEIEVDKYSSKCKSNRIIIISGIKESYDFRNNLLKDREYFGNGGWYEDSAINCDIVILHDEDILIVDTSGYHYARYCGIPSDKISLLNKIKEIIK